MALRFKSETVASTVLRDRGTRGAAGRQRRARVLLARRLLRKAKAWLARLGRLAHMTKSALGRSTAVRASGMRGRLGFPSRTPAHLAQRHRLKRRLSHARLASSERTLSSEPVHIPAPALVRGARGVHGSRRATRARRVRLPKRKPRTLLAPSVSSARRRNSGRARSIAPAAPGALGRPGRTLARRARLAPRRRRNRRPFRALLDSSGRSVSSGRARLIA